MKSGGVSTYIYLSPGDQRQPWLIVEGISVPASVRLDTMLLILWRLWNARNGLIFNDTPLDVLRATVRDMDSLACRYRNRRSDLMAWKSYVVLCCNSLS